jgi:hypothetical protein
MLNELAWPCSGHVIHLLARTFPPRPGEGCSRTQIWQRLPSALSSMCVSTSWAMRVSCTGANPGSTPRLPGPSSPTMSPAQAKRSRSRAGIGLRQSCPMFWSLHGVPLQPRAAPRGQGGRPGHPRTRNRIRYRRPGRPRRASQGKQLNPWGAVTARAAISHGGPRRRGRVQIAVGNRHTKRICSQPTEPRR